MVPWLVQVPTYWFTHSLNGSLAFVIPPWLYFDQITPVHRGVDVIYDPAAEDMKGWPHSCELWNMFAVELSDVHNKMSRLPFVRNIAIYGPAVIDRTLSRSHATSRGQCSLRFKAIICMPAVAADCHRLECRSPFAYVLLSLENVVIDQLV